jgi:prepilin-type N-terminal cleavage/methylation domain-containing protein
MTRPPVTRAVGGFTMIEMMVVTAIVGVALLLVPPNFDTFGARGRLAAGANKLLSELTAVKEQATMDGYEARLEIGRYADEKGEKLVGTRIWFTNIPAKGTEGSEQDREQSRERATSRAEERQWLSTPWHPFPEGVIVAGVSTETNSWDKLGEGDRTFHIRFFADGGVDRAVGIRVECTDLDVRTEDRTVTILLNPLTAEPVSIEGLGEIPRQRDASEFN